MSWFNLETICGDCKDDEAGCPNYLQARAAELASVERGEQGFAGIGLAEEDRVWLALCRLARRGER